MSKRLPWIVGAVVLSILFSNPAGADGEDPHENEYRIRLGGKSQFGIGIFGDVFFPSP